MDESLQWPQSPFVTTKKFRIRLEIARGLKTITLFHSYHEVDFAGNCLFGFGSLRIGRACAGKFANNETEHLSNRTRGPWWRRHDRAQQNDCGTRAGISRGNRACSPRWS